MQQYVIKFVSDSRQVGGFLRILRFPAPLVSSNSSYKTDRPDIAEILLKVALSIINQSIKTKKPLLFRQ